MGTRHITDGLALWQGCVLSLPRPFRAHTGVIVVGDTAGRVAPEYMAPLLPP